QNLVQDIEILRRMQRVDAKVESARRQTVVSSGLIEDFRRHRVINSAGPDKQSIKLVFVPGEEFEFRSDTRGNSWRKQSVKERARRDQSDESHRNIEGSAEHELVSFYQRATCLSCPSFPDSVW